MSCPYYTYKEGDFHCNKTGKDVNEDIYYKYCRNYDYGDCPIYKGQDSSSGCFLTSACVEAKGMSDDCYELSVLRDFRDSFLRNQPKGEAEIREYYFVAPQIVSAIKQKAESLSIFDSIYEECVRPCVEMIEVGKNDDAHLLYRETVKRLQKQYLL